MPRPLRRHFCKAQQSAADTGKIAFCQAVSAANVLQVRSDKHNAIAQPVCKRIAHNEGRELVTMTRLRQQPGIAIYFFDSYSSLQRESNENMSRGSAPQQRLKGTDMSSHSRRNQKTPALDAGVRPSLAVCQKLLFNSS